MKPQLTPLMLMTGLLALLNLPASAQEKPDAPPPPPPPATEKPEAPPERPRGEGRGERSPEPGQERPVAYLGVLTGPVSRELRSQFGLAEGFGLQIAEVMPDSPAAAAGLKEHDVLVKFEDQQLVNMEQLQTLVRSRKKNDQVSLTVITGGQQKQLSVTIGERMARVETERHRGFMPPGGPWFGFGGPGRDSGNPEEWRERMNDFQREMREYQERVHEWAREGRRGPLPPPPVFEGPGRGPDGWQGPGRDGDARSPREGDRGPRGPREGEGRRPEGPRDMPPAREGGDSRGETRRSEHREYHESASVTRSDEGGIYRLSKDGDRTIFSVKPRDGEAREWPVNTEEERAALPEPLRAKLRELEEIRSSVRHDGDGRDSPRREAPPPAPRRPDGI